MFSEDPSAFVAHIRKLKVEMGSKFVLHRQVPGVNRGNADAGGQSIERDATRRYRWAQMGIPKIRVGQIQQRKS